MSLGAKMVLVSEPTVSFRSAHEISSYIVRAKMCSLEKSVGSKYSQKQRYVVCTNVTEIDAFSITFKGITFQINH